MLELTPSIYRFFFHFSGHGGRVSLRYYLYLKLTSFYQMKDYDGDEDDGYDETIYPVDHAIYGQIVDDVSHVMKVVL